jgi:Family of unknown function (DUF5372)
MRQTWMQHRVFFLLDDGTLTSVPTAWTDAAEPDVFVTVAAGRSLFRVEDLLALAELIDGQRPASGPRRPCKANFADVVRSIMPQTVHRRVAVAEKVH